MIRKLLFIFALLAGSAFGQANQYVPWTAFPQSQSYYPLSVFSQDPINYGWGSGGPCSNFATCMSNAKVNLVVGIDNATPASFGHDASDGAFNYLVTHAINYTPSNVDTTGNTSVTSVASYQAMATLLSGSQYLVGYRFGDEPSCAVMGTFNTLIPTLQGYDTTRPMLWNFTDWVYGHGSCFPPNSATNTSALQYISVGSFDLYPQISPWNGASNIPQVSGVVSTSGTAATNGCPASTYSVTYVSGTTFPAFLQAAGQVLVIGPASTGSRFTIGAVVSSSILCVTTNPGTSASIAYEVVMDAIWINAGSVAAFVNNGRKAQNLTVTFSNGSANIASANTLLAGQVVQFSTTGSLPTNFSTNTNYYVVSTGNPFTVSATPTGSAVVAGSAGSGTQTATSQSQPIWAFVDTGTSALGYSSQNGSTCHFNSDLCDGSGDNHEFRATNEEVNAEVWAGLINGATGVEYFCEDTNLTGQSAFNFCLGSFLEGVTADNNVAASVASNLTYMDGAILNLAPQLNGTLNAMCTMQNTSLSAVRQYTDYTTSCSNGILAMSTGTATVPGSAMLRTQGGKLYLFADSDRNGSASMTFTLTGYAGYKATVVYDSNAHYDPTNSSVGSTFTLNGSGAFSDTFGAHGHNYQPKVYTITTGTPNPPVLFYMWGAE